MDGSNAPTSGETRLNTPANAELRRIAEEVKLTDTTDKRVLDKRRALEAESALRIKPKEQP